MLWRRSLTAVLLAALLLAACGDDPGPQTKEGFISAADDVCQDLFSDFARASSNEPDTPKEVADANKELANLYERLSDRLGDVPLPEQGAARSGAQGFVGSVRAALPLLENLRAASDRFVEAAEKRDRAAATRAGSDVRDALDAFRAARAESDRRAVRYGLTFCGNLG